MLLISPSTTSSSNVSNDDPRNFVLLLEDDMRFSDKSMELISNSMNHLIQKAESKQHKKLLELLEEYGSPAFDGVKKFDNDQTQLPLSGEDVKLNNWSLPIISLTCIAIAIPNIDQVKVKDLFESVREGLSYTDQVEKNLNKESKHIQRASEILLLEVEGSRKWLGKTLERSAYEGKTPTQIINSFADIAGGILNEYNTSANRGELVEDAEVIAAISMYRIANTLMHESNNSHIIEEDKLFKHLSRMIADILSACLTNIPQLVIMRCHENTLEKQGAGVVAAIDLLGRTTAIIEKLESRRVPVDKERAFIDKWRQFGRP